MGGKSSRNKGANFERRVARDLREIFVDAKRGFQTRGGGAEEPDVKGAGPFHIECKAHKKVNRAAAFRQAEEDSKHGYTPVAICKDDYREPVVRMYLGDLVTLTSSIDIGHDNPEVELSYSEWLRCVRLKFTESAK